MWLLHSPVKAAFEQAEKNGLTPTAQQQLDYEARISSDSVEGVPRILTIAGNNAEILIQGALTPRPDLFSFLFGGGNTTYADIVAALAIAEQDPDVDNITLAIDSPGGTISGLFDTLAALEAATKPIKAVVSNLAASAAFALAATADTIVANNRAARFGSVGIVVRGRIDENEFAIASTDAPKKAPDVSTEAGKAIVREELDALHQIFVESIASGRGVTADIVNADFGQGATLLADEALKRGMIDSIAQAPLSIVEGTDSTTAARNGGNQSEKGLMDLTILKAQHPDVYAAAVQIGEDRGITKERERASSHIIAGEMSGDLKTALTAAKDGTEMTMTLQTQYMMAAANRSDVNNRQGDDAGADAGDSAGADTEAAELAAGNAILNYAADACGVEVGA